MDATTGSSGSGFDAALRALEDLETSVAQAREDTPVPLAVEPAPAIAADPIGTPIVDPVAGIAPLVVAEPVSVSTDALAFSDDEAPAAVIVAVPVTPIAVAPLTPAADVAVGPLPAPAALTGAAFTSALDAVAIAPTPKPGDPHAAPAAAAGAASAPKAAIAAPSRSGLLGKVAIGLGLVSSVVSAVGLVIAERTIMSAQLVVASARERQEQLESANRLVRDLRIVRDKQVELLKAQQAQLASAPVSSAELQHRIQVLQEGLLARDPLTEVVVAVREGQAMTNARLNVFEKKMDRFETVMSGR
ncbi:MAG: hypothetical protein V4618_22380 [Pseudomonadota bacterium]